MSTSDNTLKPVLLALPSISPSLAIQVLPFGMTVHRILVNGDGKTHDLLVGPHNVQEHKDRRTFLNTLVGRYANRIPAGESKLEKDGVTSTLNVSATQSPEVHLHGGADGFDRRTFEVVEPSDTGDYHLFSEKEKEAIKSLPAASIFKLTSPAGDQGYPGELDVEVLLGLTEPSAGAAESAEERELGSVIVVYRARLAAGQAKTVTPVNLTRLWGFNLDASLVTGYPHPTPDVKKHELDIKGSNRVALRHDGLATGELTPTPGTAYDHSHKLIGEGWPEDKGYDEYYLFDEPTETSPVHVPLSGLSNLDVVSPLIKGPDTSREALVTLASKQSGIRLTFETNQPGVQLYTAQRFGGDGSRKRIHGGSGNDGDGYTSGAAVFLEFHEPLAAWLHPWGQALEKSTLLGTEELYNNYTKMNVYFKPAVAE